MRKLKNEELNRLSIAEYKDAVKLPIVLVLDNLRSMNNIGSAFRTADAFRIEKIILTGISAQPPHREIHKTALGATESVDWLYKESTKAAIIEVKKEGYHVIAIEQTDSSTMLNEFVISGHEKYCLIFGNEVMGVSAEAMNNIDECIEIPQFGTKHSLNVSVSVGIVLWTFHTHLGQ